MRVGPVYLRHTNLAIEVITVAAVVVVVVVVVVVM